MMPKKITLIKGLATISFLLVTSSFFAQIKATDSFYQARAAYFNGDFGQIHKNLVNCVDAFDLDEEAKDLYRTKGVNRELVFRVYKLITTAYYETNEDYRAQEMINKLIRYFDDGEHSSRMTRIEVIEKLYNTNF